MNETIQPAATTRFSSLIWLMICCQCHTGTASRTRLKSRKVWPCVSDPSCVRYWPAYVRVPRKHRWMSWRTRTYNLMGNDYLHAVDSILAQQASTASKSLAARPRPRRHTLPRYLLRRRAEAKNYATAAVNNIPRTATFHHVDACPEKRSWRYNDLQHPPWLYGGFGQRNAVVLPAGCGLSSFDAMRNARWCPTQLDRDRLRGRFGGL